MIREKKTIKDKKQVPVKPDQFILKVPAGECGPEACKIVPFTLVHFNANSVFFSM